MTVLPQIGLHQQTKRRRSSIMPNEIAITSLAPGAKTKKKKKASFRPAAKLNKAKKTKQQVSKPPPQSSPVAAAAEAGASLEDRQRQKTTPNNTVASAAAATAPAAKNQTAVVVTGSGTSKKPKAVSTSKIKRKPSASISAGSSRSVEERDIESTISTTRDVDSKRQKTGDESSAQVSTTTTATEEPASETHPKQSSTTTTAIVAAPSTADQGTQDKEILEKAQAEATEGAPRLSSFCTPFKRPRKKHQRRRNRTGEGGEAAAAANAAAQGGGRKKNDGSNKKDETNQPDGDGDDAVGGEAAAPQRTGAPAVQIINGEIVLQKSSIMMPDQRRTVEEVDKDMKEVVVEDATPDIVNASYNSFVKRKGPQHWKVEETKVFYDALRQLGTDFCSMESFFKDRDRKQLKRKYKSELSKNPELIDMALHPKQRKEVDLSVLTVVVDPKAIEAAANDEPPEYEPTDEVDEESNSNKEGSKDDSNKKVQWEEVVEDAVEETRRSSGANETTRPAGGASSHNDPYSIPQQQSTTSFWSSYDDHPAEEDQHDTGMDEFFGGDDMGPGMDDEEQHDAYASLPDPVAKPEIPKPEPVAPLVSLVAPKKGGSKKSKRPKFKTSARKKR